MSLAENDFINKFLNEIDAGKLLTQFILKNFDNPHFTNTKLSINLLSIGKAAVAMADAIENFYPTRVKNVLIVTKQIGGINYLKSHATKRILFAGHPVPDERSYEAGEQVIEFVEKSQNTNEMLIVCISGGSSALVENLQIALDKSQLEAITVRLLHSDASISEINVIRSFLSTIKGGGLAQLIKFPSNTIVFVLSDVIGNSLSTIASGPFSTIPTNHAVFFSICEKYGLPIDNRTIEKLLAYRKSYRKTNIEHHIVADNSLALDKLFEVTSEKFPDYNGDIVKVPFQCNIIELVTQILNLCHTGSERQGKYFYILGGESTVSVSSFGRGGRNTELIARLALTFTREKKKKYPSVYAISTDGNDGNSLSGGAYLDEKLIKTIQSDARLLNALEKSIQENNTAEFLDTQGVLLKEKQTNTNLLDCILVVFH